MNHHKRPMRRTSKIESNSFFEEIEDLESLVVGTDFSQMTILQMMEKATGMAEGSELSDKFFEKIAPLATALGERLGLTPRQAVMYSIFIDNYNDTQILLSDIQRQTGARMVRLAQLQDDIDEIEKHRYIRRSQIQNRANIAYHVPYDSIKCLRENKPYKPREMRNLSTKYFMRELDKCIKSRYDMAEPYELMVEDLINLVKSNMHLKVCKALDSLKTEMNVSDWVFLAMMFTCELYHGKRFGLANLHKLYDDYICGKMEWNLENETNKLQMDGWIEYGFVDGLVDTNCVQLTKKAKKTFLSECKLSEDEDKEEMLDCKKIQTKQMFYEKDVEAQVERLGDLLSKKSFKAICQRLKSHGMRQGFACLFYGAPGTGKTETVMQLAKKTGRNIVQVDFADIKDKYVGETEKNVKAIFERYRDSVKSEKVCPILLFNEADAIIGKRLEKVDHAVDNMYNSMQNIILQEMENFEGILIATTNLEGNMDSAFERRFLYKVRFEKPSAEVRRHIWQSIIPNLADDSAMLLAKEHDFSGGQIENIARKHLVDEILYGATGDMYARLKEYCENEMIQNRKSRPCVGFKL